MKTGKQVFEEQAVLLAKKSFAEIKQSVPPGKQVLFLRRRLVDRAFELKWAGIRKKFLQDKGIRRGSVVEMHIPKKGVVESHIVSGINKAGYVQLKGVQGSFNLMFYIRSRGAAPKGLVGACEQNYGLSRPGQ